MVIFLKSWSILAWAAVLYAAMAVLACTAQAADRPAVDCDTIWQTPAHGEWYDWTPTYTDPYDDTADWRFSSPEQQGMDSQTIANGVASVSGDSDLRSIIVVRNDTIVHEEYFHGGTRFEANNIHSASKSILSALLGIAIDEGYISGVDQTISSIMPQYFSSYPGPDDRRDITVRHLMTMTAGLDWVEDNTEYTFGPSDNWVQKILDRGLDYSPGTTYEYSTGVAHLASAVITNATGMSTCEYAHTRLFEPLNINAEHWGKDPQGIFSGGYNVYLTPREMAQFGLLFLNDGKLNGQQIIPAAFVAESLSDQVRESAAYDYGYYWWKRELAGYDTAIAWGWGGQFIYIVPDLDLMLVSTSDTSTNGNEINAERLLRQYIIPAVEGPPIPEPSVWMMVLGGVIVLSLLRLRRNKNQ